MTSSWPNWSRSILKGSKWTMSCWSIPTVKLLLTLIDWPRRMVWESCISKSRLTKIMRAIWFFRRERKRLWNWCLFQINMTKPLTFASILRFVRNLTRTRVGVILERCRKMPSIKSQHQTLTTNCQTTKKWNNNGWRRTTRNDFLNKELNS